MPWWRDLHVWGSLYTSVSEINRLRLGEKLSQEGKYRKNNVGMNKVKGETGLEYREWVGVYRMSLFAGVMEYCKSSPVTQGQCTLIPTYTQFDMEWEIYV